MLAEPMTIDKAKEIAAQIWKGRRKYGAQYRPSYPNYEVQEAVAVLFAALGDLTVRLGTMVPKEELTLANRRLAAAEARVAKLAKKNEKESGE